MAYASNYERSDPLISLETADCGSFSDSWEILDTSDFETGPKMSKQQRRGDNDAVVFNSFTGDINADGHLNTINVLSNENDTKSKIVQEWLNNVAAKEERCDFCHVIESECLSPETLEFWKTVQEPSDPVSRCHKKFYRKFVDQLKQTFPKEPGIKNTRTSNLLRILLRVENTDTAPVLLENVVRLTRLFGPIKAQGDRCILIEQLHILSEKSLQLQNGNKKQRLSWFAGEMTRENAEQRLRKEEDNTFLIRISSTNDMYGDFCLSVKHCSTIYHFQIKGQPKIAAGTNPFSSKLIFKEKEYNNLVEIVEDVRYNAVVQDGDDDAQTHIWCQNVCPDLPLNGVIIGYKKARRA